MLEIVIVPNPILKKRAAVVEKFDSETKKLIAAMQETLDHNPRRGVGLAAPQVGFSQRILLAKDGRVEGAATFVLVNPEIIKKSSQTDLDYEGCLSIPDVFGLVERHLKIVVKAQNPLGRKITLKTAGFFARILQHEIDHLDGILITDKIVGRILNEEEYKKITET